MSNNTEPKKRRSKSQVYASAITKLVHEYNPQPGGDKKDNIMLSTPSRGTLNALAVALVEKITEIMVEVVNLSKKKTIKEREARVAFQLLLVNSPSLDNHVENYTKNAMATFEIATEATEEPKKKQHKSNKAGIFIPVNKINKQIRRRTGGSKSGKNKNEKSGFYKVSGKTAVFVAAGVEAIFDALLVETIRILRLHKKQRISDKFIGMAINDFYHFKDLWPRVVIETTAPTTIDPTIE